ncbi:MAG: type IV pilin protein [Gammaproteobacteria bacterium]|nr:type IV pilin protein [Gammaproteobacteria bacterium]
MSPKRVWGLTLVELMIAVAVLGILSALAYPIYQDQVRKSRRATAKGALLELSQIMERRYTENNEYGGSLPFATAPKEDANTKIYYDLSLSLMDNNTAYSLQAVARPAQAGDTACSTLTLQSSGIRGPDNCW